MSLVFCRQYRIYFLYIFNFKRISGRKIICFVVSFDDLFIYVFKGYFPLLVYYTIIFWAFSLDISFCLMGLNDRISIKMPIYSFKLMNVVDRGIGICIANFKETNTYFFLSKCMPRARDNAFYREDLLARAVFHYLNSDDFSPSLM